METKLALDEEPTPILKAWPGQPRLTLLDTGQTAGGAFACTAETVFQHS